MILMTKSSVVVRLGPDAHEPTSSVSNSNSNQIKRLCLRNKGFSLESTRNWLGSA